MNDALTVPQHLLKAAAGLPEPFTANDLVVAAWRAHPERFGLKGYADQHPDSNTVLAPLMGRRGLVSKGHLDHVGPKLYRLTPAGRLEADRTERRVVNAPRWPADLDTEICRLLGTVAYQKYVANTPAWITRADRVFFLDGPGEAAREFVSLMLADAREFVMAGIPLACGRVVQPAELDALVACHGWIVGQVGKRR